MTKWVKKKKDKFWPTKKMKKQANICEGKVYDVKNSVKFWEQKAEEGINWFKKWDNAYEEDMPYFKWFIGAKVNACYNAVDRHLEDKRDKTAIIWVPEKGKTKQITYGELYERVCKFGNVLKGLGVKRGDRVGIYMPMIPEAYIAMLGCARIGAIHTVVFSAFSANSLQERMNDSGAKVLVTADGYYRRGKEVDLKSKADKGVKDTGVENVVMVKRLDKKENDEYHYWNKLMKDADKKCEPEKMGSEDRLFLLYTSGTTGKPKGIIHTTGGYITQAYWTCKYSFDLKDDDVFWCTADVGWITGHTYGCYGPLLGGATVLMYEGAPDYPTEARWWKIIEKHKVNIFYTAPTAIRMLARKGVNPQDFDLASLRILGTVGEPINEEAWLWYFKKVGGSRCPIIDTYWQTETGGAVINSLPGIGPFIPTKAGKSFPGITHTVLDKDGNQVIDEEGNLVQKSPFGPGMLRGVYKNEEKYKEEYWSFDGVYNTSDRATKDEDGIIRVMGRADDVMKVAGHRLSTAEVENAIDKHPDVSECAVVPKKHDVKGAVPFVFVVLKDKVEKLKKEEVVERVVEDIGPTAKPGGIVFVQDVPKTRSGKIMRRIVKSLVNNEELGDITTLQNPDCVDALKKKVGYKK